MRVWDYRTADIVKVCLEAEKEWTAYVRAAIERTRRNGV